VGFCAAGVPRPRRARAAPAPRALTRAPAEPVAAFRVRADDALKAKLDEWKRPLRYTSASRNLLQRHFRKVTAGSWFAEGAVLVPACVAASVERTWGVGSRQLHPRWGDVAWQG
jgi:hypothetical protein